MESSTSAQEAPAGVTAVVLTHLRPGLAGQVVRSLIHAEGFAPDRIVVVVNGAGGLDDPALESSVRMVRLAENLGPAGGFRAGIEEAFSDPTTDWAYLCEDDVGLMSLPAPRVCSLLERIRELPPTSAPVGAVVAYGRVFSGRTGHTVNLVPSPGAPDDLDKVDVAAWGSTLLSREVVTAGILPDPRWFFAFEDFDFFCRLRAGGFALLVDSIAARAAAGRQTLEGLHEAQSAHRPTDAQEPWRAYYLSRNYFMLARRHGTAVWVLAHLAYSARRLQLAGSRAERRAILQGLWDGCRGKLGKNPRYERTVGQYADGPSG
jgi:GT2 family glycosyltransferase